MIRARFSMKVTPIRWWANPAVSRHFAAKSTVSMMSTRQAEGDTPRKNKLGKIMNDILGSPKFACFEFRRALPSDKDDVLNIEPDVHEGLDYLPALYDEYMSDANRRPYVAVKDGQAVSFGMGYLVDGGTSLAMSGARTLPEYRRSGLLVALALKIVGDTKLELAELKRCTGVYQLPQWTEFLRKLDEEGHNRIIMRKKGEGFEVPPEEVASLLSRVTIEKSSSQIPVKISGHEVWDHLKRDDNREACFPENAMLISSETYRPEEASLEIIKESKVKNTFVTYDDFASRTISGISFRNTYPVPLGLIHKVDINCREEAQVFDHFVANLCDGLQKLHPEWSSSRSMFALFVPYFTDKVKFVRKCKEELGLVPSSNPKVGCDVTVLENDLRADPRQFAKLGCS